MRQERDENRERKSKENRGMKKSREAVPKRRINRCKGPGLSHGYPDTSEKKVIAMIRPKRGRRERRSYVITKVFRSRTGLRLENKE